MWFSYFFFLTLKQYKTMNQYNFFVVLSCKLTDMQILKQTLQTVGNYKCLFVKATISDQVLS